MIESPGPAPLSRGLRRVSPAAPPGKTLSLAAFCVPDIAMVAAMAAVFYLFLLFGGATRLFHDSDAGWHIRNGERILQTLSIPRVDPFSFSRPGAAWSAWEWGADVITGAVHSAAGLGGVATLYGIAIGATVWMWFRLNWAAGGNFLLACLFAAPMMSTVNLHWLARPHVFGWLFMLASFWIAERWINQSLPRRLTARGLIGIAAFTAIWANIHASFFFAPAVFSIYGAGTWLRRFVWSASPPVSPRPFFLAALVSGLATLANPAGWHLDAHVFSYLSDSALLDRIGEFQSFNFHSAGALQISLALALTFAGAFAALAARRPERFLFSLLLALAAIRSARALPVAALLALPLANGSISEVLSLARGLARPLRQWLDGALSYGDRLRAMDRQFNGAVLIPLVACCVFVFAGPRAGFPPSEFPVAASSAVAKLPADARIFAPDKFGGYLIYRFGSDSLSGQANLPANTRPDNTRRVFFDGRSDFYGADFLDSYGRMIGARPGWQVDFARWNFTHALLPPGAALTAALAADGWDELYRDGTAVLMAPTPTPRRATAGKTPDKANF